MRFGVRFDHSHEPEEFVGFAQALDEFGVDDLWVLRPIGDDPLGQVRAVLGALGTER